MVWIGNRVRTQRSGAAPASHAGGREFESRPSRHYWKLETFKLDQSGPFDIECQEGRRLNTFYLVSFALSAWHKPATSVAYLILGGADLIAGYPRNSGMNSQG